LDPPDPVPGGPAHLVASPSACAECDLPRPRCGVGWTRPQAVANIPPRTTGLLCWRRIRRCPVALGCAECDLPGPRFGVSRLVSSAANADNALHFPPCRFLRAGVDVAPCWSLIRKG